MLTYSISGPILELKGVGVYATEDVAAVLTAAKNDPHFPTPTRLLIDIRESEISHSFADVRARLTLIEEQLGRSMVPFVAFVVVGVARDRLAQIYQTRAKETSAFHIEVFTDPGEARAWLVSQKG